MLQTLGFFTNVFSKTGEGIDEDNKLSLRGDSKIAKIIDGQHRLFGLERQLKEDPTFKEEEFELIVTIFIDIDEEYQANIFSTINKAQTKVNKSIVYDLYSLAKTRSPQRTVHNVIKLLNEKEESPEVIAKLFIPAELSLFKA
ncbi:MAG: DGQHR domain-containing protein [Ghiorsea sp.]|nr:DGQHR domain-containing protein [Ghiorsea sp.]